MNGYLIDSNILIVSKKNYRQKYFPVIWNFFKDSGDIFVLDRVYDELMSMDDDLTEWVKTTYKTAKVTADESVGEYREVSDYLIKSNHWTAAGYDQWIMNYTKADPWLIAYAKKECLTIITDERNAGPNGSASDNEPKIPFVASALGVRTLNFWDFLDEKGFIAK